jgi:hypothetical protein
MVSGIEGIWESIKLLQGKVVDRSFLTKCEEAFGPKLM